MRLSAVICVAAEAKPRLDGLGLIRTLEGRGHQIRAFAPTSSRAMDLDQADVLVLAPNPDEDGAIVTIGRLRGIGLKMGIAVLDERRTSPFAERILEAGADVLLSPRESPDSLATKLEALVRRVRGEWARPVDDGDLDARIDVASRTIVAGGTRAEFGPTNFRLMLYLLEHFERWVSASKVIRDVFRTNHAPGTSLVRVHVCSLRKAIEPLGFRIEHRRQVGYRLTQVGREASSTNVPRAT